MRIQRRDEPVICACCGGEDRCVRTCACDACKRYIHLIPTSAMREGIRKQEWEDWRARQGRRRHG